MARTIINDTTSVSNLYLLVTTNVPSSLPTTGTVQLISPGERYVLNSGYATLITSAVFKVSTGVSSSKTERTVNSDSPVAVNYEVYNTSTGDYEANLTSAYWYTFSFSYNGSPSTIYTYIENSDAKKQITITNELSTASEVSYTPTTLQQGDSITFTFTANSGYEFTTAPYVDCYTTTTGDYTRYSATVSDDKESATLTLSGEETSSIITILTTSVATLKQSVPTTSYDFINVYTITSDNLKSLAKVRFHANGSSINVIDLGKYVTSLKKLYCTVPTSIESNIVLGLYDTNVSGLIVSQDSVELDCGNITVESTNNNSNDYLSEIKILLPFIGLETLNSSLIINKTINLKYRISMITGYCVALIYADNTLVYSFDGKLYENIPYILNDVDFNLLGQVEMNTTVLFGFTPTLIVSYHNNYNEDNTAMITNEQYALLSTLNGLNCVDNLVINNTAIADNEKSLIISELQNGVIF